jgi:hypothetical protein
MEQRATRRRASRSQAQARRHAGERWRGTSTKPTHDASPRHDSFEPFRVSSISAAPPPVLLSLSLSLSLCVCVCVCNDTLLHWTLLWSLSHLHIYKDNKQVYIYISNVDALCTLLISLELFGIIVQCVIRSRGNISQSLLDTVSMSVSGRHQLIVVPTWMHVCWEHSRPFFINLHKTWPDRMSFLFRGNKWDHELVHEWKNVLHMMPQVAPEFCWGWLSYIMYENNFSCSNPCICKVPCMHVIQRDRHG